MNQTEIHAQMHELLGRMKTLRDEIRLHIHLGGMELKDKWRDLESVFSQTEQTTKHASAEALAALHELNAKFEDISSRLANSEPFGGNKGTG